MRFPDRIERLVEEAQRHGASALHLIPNAVPRLRIGKELRPVDDLPGGAQGGDGIPAGGPTSEEDLEAFVAALIPPGEEETLSRRGQADFFVQTASSQSLHTSIYRAMEQWRVVVLLTDPLPDTAVIDS